MAGYLFIRKKAAERRREEERIREKEAKLLSADSTPETAEDFERFLLAQPNSSFLWIQYMAFQLSLADIDAARNVAERALKKINFRQEQEKMNVWVALLNLEHKYGTPETVADVLARAAQHNNPKHVYLHAVEMYERAGEDDKAEEIYQVLDGGSRLAGSDAARQCIRGVYDIERKITSLGSPYLFSGDDQAFPVQQEGVDEISCVRPS